MFNLALRSTIKVARIFDTRKLTTLIKITSRKKNPEILTFKFGNPDKFNALDKKAADTTDFEFDSEIRLFMPGCAGDAARDIKMRIVNEIEKQKYKEETVELKEKVEKGGVFKLDSDTDDDEDDVVRKFETVGVKNEPEEIIGRKPGETTTAEKVETEATKSENSDDIPI